MINAHKILSAISNNREYFEKTHGYIEKEELGPVGSLVYSKIEDFYSSDPSCTSADLDIVLSSLERDITNPKHAEIFKTTIDLIRKTDISSVNIIKDVLENKLYSLRLKLSSALLDTKQKEEVERLMEEYEVLSSRTSLLKEETKDLGNRVFSSLSVKNLVSEHFTEDNLIRLAPASLNKRIGGGAMPGHHILIYGRPESGKSLIAINMVAGFLKQGYRVLYCGNEDPAEQMLLRLISRLSGMNKIEVAKDPDKAEDMAKKSGYDNLVFSEISPGTPWELNSLTEKYSPDIVIVDQLRNLEMKAESRVNQLEAAAVAMRKLAKRNGVLVISITQAGDSADQKLVLGQGDVDFSNTGIPAQVDLMVGVGVTDEWDRINQRMLSLPKNKLSGNHSYFPVTVDPSLSKALSIDNETT